MPFDFTTPIDLTTPTNAAARSHSDRVRQILGPNGEHWIKGTSYNGDGRCLGQALHDTRQRHAGNRALELAMKRVVRARGYSSIPAFNDALGTTFADVLALLAEAEAAASADARIDAAPPSHGLSRIFCWS
jgi:hypothetical protein